MRNTTFTKALAVTLIGALPAQAQDIAGCYARAYDAAHLTSQPAQVVKAITLQVHAGSAKSTTATLRVRAADQGHARRSGQGGRRFDAFLLCDRTMDGWRCGVECDGGSLIVTRHDTQVLEFRTNHLMTGAGDSCGGMLDLAELPGQPVTYRLFSRPDDVCSLE